MKKKPDMSPTKTVNEIGQINLSGNVIPHTWYQWIKFNPVNSEKKKKFRETYEKEHTVKKRYKKTDPIKPKTDLLAANILADIVYWYRPTEIRDEKTGKVVGWKKKFYGKKLQRSYEQLAEQFGVTKLQVVRACKNLKSLGLLATFKKNIKVNGIKLINVMFMEPIPLKIKEITYSLPQESDIGTEFKFSTLPNLNSPTYQIQIHEGTEFKFGTNTYTTTEIDSKTSTENSAPQNGATNGVPLESKNQKRVPAKYAAEWDMWKAERGETTFESVFGEKPIFNGKDFSAFCQLRDAGKTVAEINDRYLVFCRTENSWYAEKGYAFHVFADNFNSGNAKMKRIKENGKNGKSEPKITAAPASAYFKSEPKKQLTPEEKAAEDAMIQKKLAQMRQDLLEEESVNAG